jgi:hypothetical protein
MATLAISPPSSAIDRIRNWLVALVFASSFISMFEPSPCDIFFLLALFFSLGSGLRLSPVLVPLMLLLLVYNLSGFVSWTLVPFDRLGGDLFLLGLVYTSFSGIFFAAYIAQDPNRYWLIVRAYWFGATIGASLALLKYFEIEPVNSLLPGYLGRAVGAYKDPNVFSTWLVPAIVSMIHALLLGRIRLGVVNGARLLLLLAALFLAFSRGAWINAITATTLTIGLLFVFSPSARLRTRILLAGIAGVAVMAALLSALLSIPETREVFLDRFTLVKSYDVAETGRFANQINSIPMLLERPFGFGPYQFEEYFGLAPHNTFLNSFAAAGWVGGITFIVFVISTFVVGFRAVVVRSPYQPLAFVSFSCFLAVCIQGIQIDMEHWRHFYWMVGLTWGLFAASLPYQRRAPTVQEYFNGWNMGVTVPPQRHAA